MREIEIKFRVRDFHAVRAKLQTLGALLEWKGNEESYFFDSAKEVLKHKHYNLRLRRWSGHKDTMTLKTKPGEEDRKYKVRNEYEIEVDNIRTAGVILEHLGFKEYLRYKKYREHWKLGDASIELDKLSGQHFVEVEAAKKRIDELVPILGLDWRNAEKRGYISLLKAGMR